MKKKNVYKWAIGAAVLALAVFLVFRLTSEKEIKGDLIEVKEGDIVTYYSFSGSVGAKDRKTYFAEAPLQISEFLVEEGEKVEKDTPLYKNTMDEEIKSDIDGEVFGIEVDENAQISPGTKIMEVVNYGDLELKVKVDEYDLNSIEIGTEVDVTINALNKTFKGEIVSISKEGVYMNGVTFFETIISIENDENIKVGMSAEAKVLDEESKNVGVLPMKAVKFKEDNTPYVTIKIDEELKSKDIEVGVTDGVNVEIKSGLNIGDKVFIQSMEQNAFGPPPGVIERQEFEEDTNENKEDNNE